MTTLDAIRNVQVNQNGEATIRYTAPPSLVGTHKLIAKYNQNNNYNSAMTNANIVINPALIPLHLDIETVTARTDGVTLKVTVLDENNTPYPCTAHVSLQKQTSGYSFTEINSANISNASETLISTPSNLTLTEGTSYQYYIRVTLSNPPIGYKYADYIGAYTTVTISSTVEVDCTTTTDWTSTNTNYMPKVSTILDSTCIEAPTGTNATSFVWSYYTGAISLADHTTIEVDAYYGANGSEGKVGLATTNFNLGDHQYRGAGNLKIQRNNALIENHDGTQPNVPQPPINTWFPLKFEIEQRQVTVEYTSGAGNPVSTTVTVGQYSSDETLNNTVRFGLQSAAPNYPKIAVKNLFITKH